MKSTSKFVAVAGLVIASSWAFTGCGAKTGTTDKMGMADRMADEKMSGDRMEGKMTDKMGGKMDAKTNGKIDADNAQ